MSRPAVLPDDLAPHLPPTVRERFRAFMCRAKRRAKRRFGPVVWWLLCRWNVVPLWWLWLSMLGEGVPGNAWEEARAACESVRRADAWNLSHGPGREVRALRRSALRWSGASVASAAIVCACNVTREHWGLALCAVSLAFNALFLWWVSADV